MDATNLEQEIKSGFSIVNFSAPWCADCKRIEPIMNELGKIYKIIKINIDENEPISSSFGIRRIPTLIFFKDGVEVGERLVEPSNKDVILNAIKENEK